MTGTDRKRFPTSSVRLFIRRSVSNCNLNAGESRSNPQMSAGWGKTGRLHRAPGFSFLRLPLQVPRQPALQPVPDIAKNFDDDQVEYCRPDVGLEIEGAGIGATGLTKKVEDSDDGDDR